MIVLFLLPQLLTAQCGQITFGPITVSGAGVVFDVILNPKNEINELQRIQVSVELFNSTGSSNALATINATSTIASVNPFFTANGFTTGLNPSFVSVPSNFKTDFQAFNFSTSVPISNNAMTLFRVYVTRPSGCYTAKLVNRQIVKVLGQSCSASTNVPNTGLPFCIQGIDLGGTIESIPPMQCAGSTNHGIPDVLVNINNIATNLLGCNTVTGSNGKYLCNVPILDYRIRPSKNGNLNCGLSEVDLAMIQSHILNVTRMKEPWQRIAADVNNSGTISTADLFEIRKIILNLKPNPTVTSWAFVPTDYYFKSLVPSTSTGVPSFNQYIDWNPAIDPSLSPFQGFIGVKKGDVNGSCTDCGGLAPSEQSVDNSVVSAQEIIVEDVAMNANEMKYIRFKANKMDNNTVYALQLAYDESLLDILNFKELGFKDLEYSLDKEQNTLKMIGVSESSEGLSLDEGEAVFLVQVRAKQDISSLEKALWQTKEDIGNQYVTSDGSLGKFSLSFEQNYNFRRVINTSANVPNPFKNETFIHFRLADESMVKVTVSDITGRVVSSYEGLFGAGNNDYLFQYNNEYTGLLFYKIESKEATFSGKMMKVN